MGVTQVVEPDVRYVRSGDETVEALGSDVWVEGRAAFLGEGESRVMTPAPRRRFSPQAAHVAIAEPSRCRKLRSESESPTRVSSVQGKKC